MLGKIEGRRRREWQRMRWLDGITDSMDMGLGRLRELVMDGEAWACCSPWSRKELDTTEQLNWTELRSVIAFLPGSKRLLISWLQSPSMAILEPKKITVSTVSPSICHEVMGPDAMILDFWMLSLKPTFSLSSFTFIKRLFSSSLSDIRVVSSAHLRLLIVLPAILIPACAFSNPAFLMMYSAYKLNKQGDNIQPWHTPFPILAQSVVPCLVLIASWPAYRFLRRQVRWSGIPISLRVSGGPHSQRL